MAEPGAIEADIFIPSPREHVFRFFVDPSLAAEWLGEVRAPGPSPGGVVHIELAVHHEGTLVKVADYGGPGQDSWEGRAREEELRIRWRRSLARLYAAAGERRGGASRRDCG
jgi:uncharacterized protein YndB with AHSA1/START domain